ncbi:MAG TPA: SpoIIE family protein phosphatase [Bryobacteraceae bacterium]|nr:SpoIIE family protein phosphatase [Bryobacteraceae bacterium]
MEKGSGRLWRAMGPAERVLLLLLAVYVALRISGISSLTQSLAGLAAFMAALVVAFHLARRGMQKAIWRLRNRLIVAYLFIAVVPVVLILALVAIAGWAVIGQMAVYLVNTELSHRQASLMRQAEALARIPVRDPEMTLNRVASMMRNVFPNFELITSGREDLRYPEGAQIQPPPTEWKRASGLILRRENGEDRLYAWAHAVENGSEVTIAAPVTQDLLSELVPGLGDVSFAPLMSYPHESHVPAAQNLFDFGLLAPYLVDVPRWDSPRKHDRLILYVRTRASAVLGKVFQKLDWAELALGIFIAVSIIFLIVEMVSLIVGVQLSRTITGAVHELYEGTQRIKEGDFSYRIPVNGSDQLAELTSSFNTMTQNLGRLIVVAKEKERLESELAIAREVQKQLFPKDVPFTKTLELKGVCSPARMVSGDYYDFMPVSDHSLAFAIGDVAGKGISAALLMATIQSSMRAQLGSSNGTGPKTFSTASLVATLNRQLYANTTPEKYATFYFALYEEATNSLTYTNAGHLSPMLVRAGEVQTLDSTGTVVGAFPIARYEERTVPLEHGDILVAYTDGIVEPENAYGEMFGEERLKDLVIKYSGADSSEIIAHTMEAVIQWTGSSELQDDMTMVVARRI